MGRRHGWWALTATAALVLGGCGGGGGGGETSPRGGDPLPDDPPVIPPPPPPDPTALRVAASLGDWTFYEAVGEGAGASDVSADEGGNVYVAAGSAVFAKRRDDLEFLRFDADDAALTKNCSADGTVACEIASVAGAAPGRAVIGFAGVGTDGDLDPEWQQFSGGADVLRFDGTRLTRERHVLVASPPHVVSYDPYSWESGRRKMRQILRVAVEHDPARPQYGDVWVGGTHGSFAVLLANPERRGWTDAAASFPGFEDARGVWEHDHPAIHGLLFRGGGKGTFEILTGSTYALAIDPTTGDPWAANDFRMALKRGYGARPDGWDVPVFPPDKGWDDMTSFYDVWKDPPTPVAQFDAANPAWADAVTSLSFCPDGTLWIGSGIHGLAVRPPGPPGLEESYATFPIPAERCWAEGGHRICSVWAVACDPTDGSVWVGFGGGGIGRFKDGAWSYPPEAAPAYAVRAPVRSIQIDRWAGRRIVYFAHVATARERGGVTAYRGP